MSDKTPRVIAVRDDTVFDDIKVTTYASSEALDAAVAADLTAGLSPRGGVSIGVAVPKFGLAEIDGEAKLVPQDGERLTVPASAGRHVYNGTDEIKGYDGADDYVDRIADQLEAMGVGELLRSGRGWISGYEETFPEGCGVKVTEVPLNFVSIGEITNPKRDT